MTYGNTTLHDGICSILRDQVLMRVKITWENNNFINYHLKYRVFVSNIISFVFKQLPWIRVRRYITDQAVTFGFGTS